MSLSFSGGHYCWQSLSILTFTILFNILKASIISLFFNVFSSTVVISVFLALKCHMTSFPICHSDPVNSFCLLNVFRATLFLSLLREIVSNGKALPVFNQPPLPYLVSQDMFVAYFINLLFVKADPILQWNYPFSFSSNTRVKYVFGVNNPVQLLWSYLGLVYTVCSLKSFLLDFLLAWISLWSPFRPRLSSISSLACLTFTPWSEHIPIIYSRKLPLALVHCT